MGITLGTVRQLIRGYKDNNPFGSALTFGVHGVDCTYDELVLEFSKENYRYVKLEESEIKDDNITQFGTTVHQNTFFKMLGFSNVDSLDAFDNEMPTYVVDLNNPIEDDRLLNKYDAIFDFGTSEHCFNLPQVLRNITDILKVGGSIIQSLPINNWINHGYYQISPVLLYDFYAANGFENLNHTIIFQIMKDGKYAEEYNIDNIECSMRFEMPHRSAILFTANKKVAMKKHVNPIQGYYRQTFGNEKLAHYEKQRKEIKVNRIV